MKVLMLSGAPVAPELILRVRKQWPQCAPVSGYGSSETGYAIVTRPSYTDEQLQTSGKAIDGMEIRVDPASENAGIGELVIRGAYNCAGYYANQAATDDAYDAEGGFSTATSATSTRRVTPGSPAGSRT